MKRGLPVPRKPSAPGRAGTFSQPSSRCSMQSSKFLLLALVVGLSAHAAPVLGQAEGAPADWLVTTHTVVTEEERDITGDLIVASGATLELRGASLRIGGVLRVAE